MTVTRFCQACGAPLTPGYRFCGACGQPIAANGGGVPVSPMTAPPRVRATPARSHLVVVLLALLLILVVGGEAIWWFLWQNSQTATETVATPSSPYSPARTGDITTGPTVAAASQTIPSSGGTIAVSKSGDPLDGFVIDVPANAYADSRTFAVSYAPVTQQTFGSDIHPISPMITVDNDGGYSDELMYVRVPVRVPEGSFAMGFLYDAQSKQLEGMPLVGRDADSITIATRHFSNFFISMIDEALLKNINSGFQPGIDDWQFDNVGSYVAPNGHCEGQSIAAMWYYYAKPDGVEACLYNRYDNNGDPPATPTLWQDDSLGYRFCSTIQQDYVEHGLGAEAKWETLAGVDWKFEDHKWKRIDVGGIGDASTWRLFAYSIQASGQPQLVITISNAGGAHALICYAVSDNGTLRIADPNYHGRDDRKIEFVDNQFKPYSSGDTKADIDAGKGKAYEKITYQGAWTIVPYDKIAGRWTEFKDKDKTIGNDRFPAYELEYCDTRGEWLKLEDGIVTTDSWIRLSHFCGTARTYKDVYQDGELISDIFTLKPGNNKFGVYITGGDSPPGKYIDFQYFNIIYNSLAIDPPSLDGEPNTQYTFTAKADSPPTGARYDWYVDGSISQSDSSTTFTSVFPSEGNYKVSVTLVDSASKEVQTAEATASIKKPTTSASNTTKIHGNMGGVFVLNDWTKEAGVMPMNETDFSFFVPSFADYLNITWSGNAFSGTTVGQYIFDWTEAVDDVSGTLSPDGKTLLTLDYTFHYKNADLEKSGTYKLVNIPFETQVGNIKRYTVKSNLQSHITKIEFHEITYNNGEKSVERTVLAPPVKDSPVGYISFDIIYKEAPQ